MLLELTFRCFVEEGYDDYRLDDVCRIFPSMVRTSYNLIRDGKSDRQIRSVLLQRYHVSNCKWRQDAIIQADAVNESQKQLINYTIAQYKQKISNSKQRLKKVRRQLKKKGLEAKIDKYQRKVSALQLELEDSSYPRSVFGTRKLLRQIRTAELENNIERRDDLKSEWKKARSNQFLAVGQADSKGNRNARLGKKDQKGQFYLELRNWMPKERLQYPLHVPEYCRKMIDQAISQGEECKIPYTVRVIKVEHGYKIHITVASKEIPLESWNRSNIVGIDLNPEGIAVTMVSPRGNLLKTRFFKEPRLVVASTNKRNNLLGELVKKMLNWIKKTNGCNLIAIENLKFKRAYDSNSKSDRILSNFAKSKMVQAIKSRAIKEKVIVVETDPKYSSSIALEKYARQFQGFQRHELAGFIIARRALGYSEKPTLNYFEDHLKQTIAKKRKNKEDRKLLFMWKYCSSTENYGYHPLSQILYHDPMERKSSTVALDESKRIVTKLVTPRPATTPSYHVEGTVGELSHAINDERGAPVQVDGESRETGQEGIHSNPSTPETNLIQIIRRSVKQVQGQEKLAI